MVGAHFASNLDGECALVVMWAGMKDADAAAVVINPRLMGHITGRVVAPPDIQLLTVLAESTEEFQTGRGDCSIRRPGLRRERDYAIPSFVHSTVA